ncbi:Acyl-CoA dehydrogenase [Novosphingobium sp. CF614]|uniref:acyl-CoA dehydrogenase family protein n=1 Tax=Novosphingobium sp. CF614 TaxID=1884364 RepID=UPI0008E0DD15|nr:acyl-CoA dehydrogenase family protein [Novosphingobium sp. CF614]SFF91710.1 Acyl-CoA dehydrogenase [Novosphingobium sp. CF614]
MNSHSVSDENALGDEVRGFLAKCLPALKDDMKQLAAFARQSDYHDDILWNDPLFRARAAALQAELDALEHALARAMQGGDRASDDLAVLAGITGSELQRKVGGLIAQALGPFGLAQEPAHHGGLAADELPGPFEAPGGAPILAFRDGDNELLRQRIAETSLHHSGARLDLGPSGEDAKLRDGIDRFTAAAYALPARAALLAANRDNWDHFAAMGWLGLGIPEEAGGHGGSLATMMLLAERLGAGLAIEPYVGGIVYPAAALQVSLDAAEAAKLLAPAVAGKTRLAMACHEAPARGGLRWTKASATPDKDGYVLDGCKVAVDGGGTATDYLVSARTAGEVYDPFGHSLFLVPRGTPGVRVHAWRMIDGSDMATVELDAVRVPGQALLGKPGAALAALGAGMDVAIVANAFGVVGAMEAALAAAPGCLSKDGQPGEAMRDSRLQRQRAQMLAALEQARSAALLGLASLSEPDGRRRAYATSATKAVIVRASDFVCGQAIRLHGETGIAEEGPAGHFRDFAAAANSLRGSLDFHLSRMSMLM